MGSRPLGKVRWSAIVLVWGGGVVNGCLLRLTSSKWAHIFQIRAEGRRPTRPSLKTRHHYFCCPHGIFGCPSFVVILVSLNFVARNSSNIFLPKKYTQLTLPN